MKSMYLALVALIVAAIALLNSFCTHIEDNTLIVSFLGVLVTLLVGLNIVQYIFAEKEVKRLAKPVANDVAKVIASDIGHIFDGKLLMQKATGPYQPGEEMIRLDILFQALDEYSRCHFSVAVQSSVDAALLILQKRLRDMQAKGGLRVLEGKKDSYISTLEGLHSPYLRACNALLYLTTEKPREYDIEILSPEDKSTLRLNADEHF